MPSEPLTTAYLRRAVSGETESLEWIVKRFSPLLLAQAKWRLGERLRGHCDAEDLVADAWLVALPRLAELPDREGRLTPVVLKYLSSTILHQINNLARKHLRRLSSGEQEERFELTAVPSPHTGVVTRVVRGEQESRLHEALARLEPMDREILLLRGIEQRSNGIVAELLGIEEAAASMRYRRAMDRLRGELPGTLLDELT